MALFPDVDVSVKLLLLDADQALCASLLMHGRQVASDVGWVGSEWATTAVQSAFRVSSIDRSVQVEFPAVWVLEAESVALISCVRMVVVDSFF